MEDFDKVFMIIVEHISKISSFRSKVELKKSFTFDEEFENLWIAEGYFRINGDSEQFRATGDTYEQAAQNAIRQIDNMVEEADTHLQCPACTHWFLKPWGGLDPDGERMVCPHCNEENFYSK